MGRGLGEKEGFTTESTEVTEKSWGRTKEKPKHSKPEGAAPRVEKRRRKAAPTCGAGAGGDAVWYDLELVWREKG